LKIKKRAEYFSAFFFIKFELSFVLILKNKFNSMRASFLCLIWLFLGFFSCVNSPTIKPKPDLKNLTPDQIVEKFNLYFDQPVIIDSSDNVMYPIILENSDDIRENSGYGSGSSYSNTTKYCNILFYNTNNSEYHLLTNDKVLIYSFSSEKINNSTYRNEDFIRSGLTIADNFIYYSIRKTDSNDDGKINAEDANYLYISNKKGANFKQISPDSFNVVSWKIDKRTNKILFSVSKDTDHDKKFTYNDEHDLYIYDLVTDKPSKQVLTEDYKKQLKKQFSEQWTKK